MTPIQAHLKLVGVLPLRTVGEKQPLSEAEVSWRWRQRHGDRAKELHRDWQRRNKERVAVYQRRWHEKNMEHLRAYRKAYRARRKAEGWPVGSGKARPE